MKRAISRLAAFAVAAALAGSAAAADKMKVGFVFLGPVGDHGWTY